jgi:hypothetical protein
MEMQSVKKFDFFGLRDYEAPFVMPAHPEVDDDEAASAEDANVGDYINVLFNTAFNGLQAVGHTMGFVDVAANDAGEILNIPPFVIPLVLLVTIIIIGFAIWAAIMRQ